MNLNLFSRLKSQKRVLHSVSVGVSEAVLKNGVLENESWDFNESKNLFSELKSQKEVYDGRWSLRGIFENKGS